MDSGAAGHAMLEGMFLPVKLQRKTEPHKFVAANGERIRETMHFKTNEGTHRFTTSRSASVVKRFISMHRVVRS